VLPPAFPIVLAVLGDARPRRHARRGLDPERVAKLERRLGPLGDLGERGGGLLLDRFDRERDGRLVRARPRLPYAAESDRRHYTITAFTPKRA
jgi:hypothetical protein